MGTMRTLFVVAALTACSGPMAQPDAAHTVDAVHAGDDAIITLDAGTDAASSLDAWSAPDAFVGPDAWAACDLYTNAGCTNPAQTCRPTFGPHSNFDGPLMCTDDGSIGEGRTLCTPTVPCAHGLFCETNGRCVRPCMHGSACPNLADGTPQTCTTTGAGDLYHCV